MGDGAAEGDSADSAAAASRANGKVAAQHAIIASRHIQDWRRTVEAGMPLPPAGVHLVLFLAPHIGFFNRAASSPRTRDG
jgi:hypothetical protein